MFNLTLTPSCPGVLLGCFLPKDAFLGFPRSVLADPKTVQPRDTFSEHILSISWSGSDMQTCFGPRRKGDVIRPVQHLCGTRRNKSACQTHTMKCSEQVQRTCLWLVQSLDRPKRTSGSRETRLWAKSGTAFWGALAQEPQNAIFQNRPQKYLDRPIRTKISRRFQIRFVHGVRLSASGRIFAPKIALLLIPHSPYKTVCRGYTSG